MTRTLVDGEPRLVARIPVGQHPYDVAVSDDGKLAGPQGTLQILFESAICGIDGVHSKRFFAAQSLFRIPTSLRPPVGVLAGHGGVNTQKRANGLDREPRQHLAEGLADILIGTGVGSHGRKQGQHRQKSGDQ